MTHIADNRQVIFIGGAPRSGTTLVHNLICTAAETNDRVGECSFLTAIAKSYEIGLKNWEIHTHYFFPTQDAFRAHISDLLMTSLNTLFTNLGSPWLLALKDPLLTPYFLRLHELLGKRVRFVIVMRNPYNVVRSRQQVFERSSPDKTFDAALVASIAREYVQSYEIVDALKATGSLFLIKYEDLSDPEKLNQLASFLGVTQFCEPDMFKDGFNPDDPWYSPKYGQPIDLSDRLSDLDEEFRTVVNRLCQSIQQKYGYEIR